MRFRQERGVPGQQLSAGRDGRQNPYLVMSRPHSGTCRQLQTSKNAGLQLITMSEASKPSRPAAQALFSASRPAVAPAITSDFVTSGRR